MCSSLARLFVVKAEMSLLFNCWLVTHGVKVAGAACSRRRSAAESAANRVMKEACLAIVWLLEWDGLTPEQYEALKEAVGWERDVPNGLHAHAASFNDKGL